jgi:hypothetical protein
MCEHSRNLPNPTENRSEDSLALTSSSAANFDPYHHPAFIDLGLGYRPSRVPACLEQGEQLTESLVIAPDLECLDEGSGIETHRMSMSVGRRHPPIQGSWR